MAGRVIRPGCKLGAKMCVWGTSDARCFKRKPCKFKVVKEIKRG